MPTFIPGGTVLGRLPISDLLHRTRQVMWFPKASSLLPSLEPWVRKQSEPPYAGLWIATVTADLAPVITPEEAAIFLDLVFDSNTSNVYLHLAEDRQVCVGFLFTGDAEQIFRDWHALHPKGA